MLGNTPRFLSVSTAALATSVRTARSNHGAAHRTTLSLFGPAQKTGTTGLPITFFEGWQAGNVSVLNAQRSEKLSEPYTNGDAIDVIEDEGLGYAVQHYTSGPFRDPETQRLWDAAASALNALEAHLERDTGREVS